MKIHDRDGSVIFQGIFNRFIKKRNLEGEKNTNSSDDSVFFLRVDEKSGYNLSKIVDIFNEVMVKLCEENSSLLVFVNFQNINFARNNDKKRSILFDLIKKEAKLKNKCFLLKPSKDDRGFLFFDNLGKKRQLNGFKNSVIVLKNTRKTNHKIFIGNADILKSPQDILLIKSSGISTLFLLDDSGKKEDFLFCSGRSLQFDLYIFSFSNEKVEFFEPEIFGGNSKYLKSEFDNNKISEIVKLFLSTDSIEYGMSSDFLRAWTDLIDSVNMKKEGNCFEKSNRFNR